MKKTLYYKFILGYILFALAGILFIETIGSRLVMSTLAKNKANDIYEQAYHLASSPAYISTENLHMLSLLVNSDILYIDSENNVISSSFNITDSKKIKKFDITDFGNKIYKTGTFYDLYSKEVITVPIPVIDNYKTIGYIILNYPCSDLTDTYNNIMIKVYIIAGILFLFSITILLIFTFVVYLPVRKLSSAASEYAKGNFTYKGLEKFTGDDEIGRLGISLNFMASELNTLEEDQKKFIANISHDFRSPLTSIKGYIEAMADGTIPPELQGKYLDIVLFETERLTKLTSNLLTLNTWDTKGSRLDLSEVNIYQLIKPILLSFEGKCAKKKINFDFTIGSKDYVVIIDKEKIQQVIYNLIDNAIKFSNNNSTIYIDISDKNGKIFVSIKDTGIGIPKASLSKIWDRFYKTDLSRGKDKTGSGLGLSIAREIIKNHGENINVISTEGVGTEFIFTLKQA
ncbi:MAG: HAMP domain-containing protein [Lachnospira sp.]|nr:HAMP domain-containing protein [Lachnospira sp.]